MANFSTGMKRAILGNGVDEASVKTLLDNCVMAFYAASANPVDANAAETGTLIGLLTLNGAAFTAGVHANGLIFDVDADGLFVKPESSEWSFLPEADAVIKYARLYDNDYVTGASTTARRIDLTCGITVGDCRFLSLNVYENRKVYCREVAIDLLSGS